MDTAVFLTRPEGETHRVPAVFVPEERRRRRPKTRFRARLDTPEEVERARHEGLPVYLLTPEIVSAFRYPIRFPPRLLVSREVSPAVDSVFQKIEFRRGEAAGSPRFEDLGVAMLRVDPLAARALVKRNPELLDPERLLVRVIEERVQREATFVRLQEISPAIPVVGESIPLAPLRRHDRNNTVTGLLA